MKFTFGADVEFFLKADTDRYVSAFRILNGTKHEPEILKCDAGLHWDNVAVEFSSIVTSSENEFVSAIKTPIMEIRKKVSPLRLVPAPFAIFPSDQLVYFEENEFGCNPDFDAWELRQNQPPLLPDDRFRSCGGHIHIGFVKGSPTELLDPYGKVAIVKMLDIMVGIPSVILDQGSTERRKLYGKAGCHRPTGYGVEYRTLSNFWTKSENTIRLIYKLSRDALSNVSNIDEIINLAGGKDTIINCINNGDLAVASKITEEVVLPIVETDTKICWSDCKLK